MKPKPKCLVIVGLLISLSAFSEVIYELIPDSGGDALAMLEFSAVPAGISEVNSLSLTTAGDAAFASFGLIVSDPTFTTTIRGLGEFVTDGADGLSGRNPSQNGDFASVIFSAGGVRDRGDELIPIINIEARADGDSHLIELATEDGGEFSITGSWHLSQEKVLTTPEPASYLLFAMGIAAMGYMKARRYTSRLS